MKQYSRVRETNTCGAHARATQLVGDIASLREHLARIGEMRALTPHTMFQLIGNKGYQNEVTLLVDNGRNFEVFLSLEEADAKEELDKLLKEYESIFK